MSRTVLRGSRALQELLASSLHDVRELDRARFPDWLERHLQSWRRDPLFLQRAMIRDLRLGTPELQEMEEQRAGARDEYEASESYGPREAALRDLSAAENAVAGLTHAMSRAEEAAERERLALKREHFLERAEQQRARVRELTEASAAATMVEQLTGRIEELRETIGFNREVARLDDLQRKRGRSSGRSGAAFERSAREVVESEVVPELATSAGDPEIVLLHGVTLAAARTEIDQLLIRAPASANRAVEVLALVEAKRNPNDLAKGLAKRLENLAWLAGHQAGYEAEAYTTRTYETGHFEGVAAHSQHGSRYRFNAESFRHFLEPLRAGALPSRLYLVSRPEPLWGLGSGAMARIAHRVSTDLEWDPEDSGYLEKLLHWCQSLADTVEAPDLLRRYAADPERSRQVLLIES